MRIFDPEFLKRPSAYEHPVNSIEVRETHISWVFLTGDFAYKVKKEVKFGDILDFSTLSRRKEFCHKEIELNARFSKDIYLNVFSINSEGKINGSGEPIEYGVRMKQLPEECLMSNKLKKNEVTIEAIKKIAESLAIFHKNSKKVPEYGKLKYIGEKWDENFRTTSQFRTIDEEFREKVVGFMIGNKGLFQERINGGWITDNHGDFQSQNIFLLPNEEVKIFDCIEFNPLLRYGDLSEDVGFLAMDLDFWDKTYLSDHFVKTYIECSGDELLDDIIYFFKCYRAYVRGKVYGFQAANDKDEKTRKELKQLSDKYFQLAHSYVPKFS
ncbi:MAG: gluconokinase [Candidatus Hodarchaeales archaeon]